MTIDGAAFAELTAARRSLRAFKSTPVDRDTLDSVFAAALRAPSNCNTQPWIVHVASGDRIETLRENLPQKFMAGEFTMDFPYDGSYEGVYKERQTGHKYLQENAAALRAEQKQVRRGAAELRRNAAYPD